MWQFRAVLGQPDLGDGKGGEKGIGVVDGFAFTPEGACGVNNVCTLGTKYPMPAVRPRCTLVHDLMAGQRSSKLLHR